MCKLGPQKGVAIKAEKQGSSKKIMLLFVALNSVFLKKLFSMDHVIELLGTTTFSM